MVDTWTILECYINIVDLNMFNNKVCLFKSGREQKVYISISVWDYQGFTLLEMNL